MQRALHAAARVFGSVYRAGVRVLRAIQTTIVMNRDEINTASFLFDKLCSMIATVAKTLQPLLQHGSPLIIAFTQCLLDVIQILWNRALSALQKFVELASVPLLFSRVPISVNDYESIKTRDSVPEQRTKMMKEDKSHNQCYGDRLCHLP